MESKLCTLLWDIWMREIIEFLEGLRGKPSMSDLLGGLMRLWALVASLFCNFLGLILLDCSPFL